MSIYFFRFYSESHGNKFLSQADFGKVMKCVFPNVKPRRLGQRGQSKYPFMKKIHYLLVMCISELCANPDSRLFAQDSDSDLKKLNPNLDSTKIGWTLIQIQIRTFACREWGILWQVRIWIQLWKILSQPECQKSCSLFLYSSQKIQQRLIFWSWCPSFPIFAVLRKKVPNVLLSRCHTKRRICVHGCAHPSFGLTPTFKMFFAKKKILIWIEENKVGFGVNFEVPRFGSRLGCRMPRFAHHWCKPESISFPTHSIHVTEP